MNSRHWDVLPRNGGCDCRIITGFDDPLIFIGRANQQPGKFEVGPPLLGGRCFRIKIDNHPGKLQLPFSPDRACSWRQSFSHHLCHF